MALALFDRVQETSTTAGTGSIILAGAVSGFQSFAVVGNGNTCYYTIVDGSAWEVGVGTYSTSGPTLARTTILSNSNGNTSPLTLTANSKSVFLTYPASKSVNLNESGNVSPLGTVVSGIWNGTTIGVAYGGTGVTASSGANSVVLRDSNQNVAVNRVNQANTNTTAAGGTTALTAASSYIHTLVGTGGQTYSLPDATTLTTGVAFVFNNLATGTLTIANYAGTTIGTIPSGGAGAVFLTLNSTVGGTWDLHAYLPEGVTFGTNAFNLGTSIISGGTWQGGTIQTGYGGTGLTSYTSGGAVYANSSSTLTSGTLPISAGGTGNTTGNSATTSQTNFSNLTIGGSQVLYAGNYNSYAPTLTGTGASGTWGINISGNAATATTAANYLPLAGGTLTGQLVIGAAGTAGSPTLRLNTSTSGAFVHTQESFAANLTSGQHIISVIGKVGNTKNSGYIGYTWAGDASNSNYVTIGHWGNDDLFRVYADGNVTVGTSTVLNASNYNSYAPTLTGGGASGTWGINITGSAGSAGSVDYNNLTNKTGGTGTYTTSGDYRAPIFYDSNNTNFYVNPSDLSTIYQLFVDGAHIGGYGIIKVISDNDALISLYTESNATAGMRLQSSSGGTDLLFVGKKGFSDTTFVVDFGFAQSAEEFTVDASGNTESRTSSRAPIFYDSNNTGYYLDPNGGSNLAGTLTNTGNIVLPVGANRYVQIGSATNYYYTLQSTNDNFEIREAGTTPRLTISYPTGAITASTDFRAPIFYDSNNTAYYLDPASTSVLNAINLNTSGTALFRYLPPGTGVVSINAPFYWNAATGAINIAMIDNDTGGVVIDNEGVTVYGAGDTGGVFRVIDEDVWQTNGNNVDAATCFYVTQGAAGGWGRGNWEFYGSARAPIFYDYNNTAYYVDPAGTTVLYYANYQAATGGSNANGTVAIKIAGLSNYDSLELGVQSNYQAQIRTYGNDIHYYSGHWRTAGNVASENHQHYWYTSQSGSANWSTWKMQLNQTADLLVTGSVYAPIFYDYNDTGYYIDPNSTGTSFRGRGQMYIGPNSSGRYTRFGGDGGATDEATVSASNGNLHLDAKSGYNIYLAWYNNSTIQCGGGIASTIYYDLNNTGYYLDPASTNSLRTVGDWRSDSAAWTGEFSGKMQYHSSNWYFQYSGSALFRNSGGSNIFTIDQSGNAVASGNVTAYSDVRLKENIVTIDSALDKVLHLRGVYYNKIGNPERRVGVIAQEILEILPEVVRSVSDTNPSTGETTELLAVDYGNITGLLIEAVKQLSAKVDELQRRA